MCTFTHPFCPAVHGFLQAEYSITEGDSLNTVFQLNVKGTTQLPRLFLTGTITAAAAGTASKGMLSFKLYMLYVLSMLGDNDFRRLTAITVRKNTNVHVRLFAVNDDITLETDDRIQLRFTPTNTDIINGFESAGEYIRARATIKIIDIDSKYNVYLPSLLSVCIDCII